MTYQLLIFTAKKCLVTSYRSRLLVLASYFEVLKRVLRREPYLQYGRQTFFSNFWAEAAREVGADIDDLGDDIFSLAAADVINLGKLEQIWHGTGRMHSAHDDRGFRPVVLDLGGDVKS